MRAIRNGLHGAGIPVENSKGEWGPGQEEINVRYAEALEMADRHVIIKNGCKEIAYQSRARPSPSWRNGATTSRARRATSTLRCGTPKASTPLFARSPRRRTACRTLMRHYLGGPAHLRRARSPISSRPSSIPTSASRPARSRRRARSGASTTAPPAFACAARARKAIRVECRIGGADLNPYLAFAALIAAGLAGIEEKLELEPAVRRRRLSRRRACAEIPKTLRDATETLARLEDAARSLRRRRRSTITSTPRNGSSSNTTAASPTGN